MNFIEAESIQYLFPVGAGPSSNICPRCESAYLLLTSVLSSHIKLGSSLNTTFAATSGLVKLGRPVPLSYLSSELKSGSQETISTYIPAAWLSQYSLLNGCSVPSCCVTSYCSGVSIFFKSPSEGFV